MRQLHKYNDDYKYKPAFRNIDSIVISLKDNKGDINQREVFMSQLIAEHFKDAFTRIENGLLNELNLVERVTVLFKGIKDTKNKNGIDYYTQICERAYDYYNIKCTCRDCISAKVIHLKVAQRMLAEKCLQIVQFKDIKHLKINDVTYDDLINFIEDSRKTLKDYKTPAIIRYLESIGHNFDSY